MPLKTSDSGDFALASMSEYYVKHLPIVDDKQFLGLISEDDILINRSEEAIGTYNLSMNRPFVFHGDHLFDVMRVISEYDLTVVPVIDEEENYLGLITQDELIKFYAKSFSFAEAGGIIVLEMSRLDYSLSNLSSIVESEQGTVLSSFISSDPDSTNVIVTLKINLQEISAIVSAFQRHEYKIRATFTESEYYESLKERYDLLMSYLSV
jgi:CBS domain-containing protein